MIPLMENKMKWKKKKHPVIEIDMSSANNDGQMAEDRTSAIPTLQVQSSKQDAGSPSPSRRFQDHGINLHSGDSGIESVQVSPAQKASSSAIDMYDVPGPSNFVYLHPDRARFNHFNTIASSSREHNTIEDSDSAGGGNMSDASSNASSLTSVQGAGPSKNRHADPWGRRRSSTWTGRYSDAAVDPEFANLRARGSVGMHSLSDSLHKLTFTQTLAFPELARKLATRRRQEQLRAAVNDTSQDDFEACSKFVAVAGVFLLSLMVYGVVNKYAKV